MAISDAQYQAWLEATDQERCVLIEAQYSSGTEYRSTFSFTSSPSSTPANIPYCSYIRAVPEINTSIDGSVTFGRIELINADGEFDSWLTRAWRGWPLRVYLGDPSWDRDDFRLIVKGINGGISAPRPNSLIFGLRDKRELLTEPVQHTLLSNGDPTPLSLGTIFNAEPVLIDSANLIYRFHEDGDASVTQVRDSGASVSYTDNSNGTFTLTAAPTNGSITCDITGETTGTPAAIVDWLAQRAPDISSTDIDSTNLSAFPATYGLGLYIRDRRTVMECIEEVMRSVGGVAYFSRLGLLQMVRLEAPGTSSLDLHQCDVKEKSLTVVGIEEPIEEISVSYKKNWTIQDPGSLAGVTTEAQRDLYSRPYSIVSASNSGITTNYPLAETPDVIETLIVSSANAQTEANRLRTLRSVTRTQFKFDGFSASFQVQVGDTVTLTHPRYGFSSGADAVVVSMKEVPTKNKIVMELWK